jgi:hypothetical protein
MDADELTLARDRFSYEQAQDQRKARQDRLTRLLAIIAVFIPLSAAALGLVGTWWTTRDDVAARRDEAAQQLKVQQREAQTNFALKAAELALSGNPGPATVHNRLIVLTQMFGGEYLPPDLADRFTGPQFVNWSADDARLQLLAEIGPTLKCPEQHVAAWKVLFGGDRVPDSGAHEWIDALTLPPCPPAPSSTP